MFGVQPYAIASFFRRRGYKVTLTYNPKKYDKVIKKNEANIIFYSHDSGAHYVAVKWRIISYIGYNTFSDSVGFDVLGKSFSGFLKDYGYTGIVLISISKKKGK